LSFWLQLLSSFIVIMEELCVVAAAAAFASVVVTVALFLLSSLSSLFLYCYCQPCHSCSFFIHCLSFCCAWYPFSMIAVAHIVAAIVVFRDKNSKQNASKAEHQTQGPTSPSRGGCNGSCKQTCRAPFLRPQQQRLVMG
jgi:hypothetical protein